MDLPDRNQAVSWEGKRVVDRDGEPLGTCTGVFADTETGVTEWLDVDLEGQGRSFVPALEAAADGDSVRVSFTRDAVLSAPTVGDQEQLSKRDETELYRHYGVPVASGGSVLPDEAASSVPPAHDDAAPAGVLSSTSDDTTAGVFAADRDTPAVPAQDTDEPAGRLGGEDLVAGAAGPPETGQDLPVLDPAAASVPVSDDEVVHVDDREPFTQDGQDDEAAAPRLSRVPEQPAAAAPSPWPPPASQAGPGALSTGAPLAGVAALAAGVFVVLNALEERRRRRNSPAAKADRLRRQVGAGARTARAGAAHSLSAGGAAAATTGRRLSTAASAASADAAKKQRELLVAASAASHDLAQQRRRAARTASRRAQRRQRRIAAQLSAASARAGRTGAAATGAVAAVPAAVGSSLSGAATSVTGTTRTATRRKAKRRKASVSAAPRKVAKKGRSMRRSLARKVWRLVLAGAAGGGYVLGAKAGRERYDEITDATSAVASAPQVQGLTDAVTSRLGRER